MFRFVHFVQHESAPRIIANQQISSNPGYSIVEVLKNAPKERQLEFDAILRTIATARLIMPESIIRLAAGRYTMKEHEQFLCFMSGVNAIFTGKRMLTTMCNGWDEDITMLKKWGLKPMESFTK